MMAASILVGNMGQAIVFDLLADVENELWLRVVALVLECIGLAFVWRRAQNEWRIGRRSSVSSSQHRL